MTVNRAKLAELPQDFHFGTIEEEQNISLAQPNSYLTHRHDKKANYHFSAIEKQSNFQSRELVFLIIFN